MRKYASSVAVVDSVAKDAEESVEGEENAAENEEASKEGEELVEGVFVIGQKVESASEDEKAAGQQGQAEKEGFPAVDGGGTLRGVILQFRSISGGATKHLLAQGCGAGIG
jgi:hypothetical protein